MRRSWLIALAVAQAIAFGAYAYTFGPTSHWQLSSHAQDWARFGEYIGGLSVPCLLIGLFANAEGPRQQIESQRQQGTLDELMREARVLALSLEQMLAVSIETAAFTAHGQALSQKLDLLAAVLSEFVSRGGDSIFLLFYRDRFRATARRLADLKVTVGTGDWWLASNEEAESRRWRF